MSSINIEVKVLSVSGFATVAVSAHSSEDIGCPFIFPKSFQSWTAASLPSLVSEKSNSNILAPRL